MKVYLAEIVLGDAGDNWGLVGVFSTHDLVLAALPVIEEGIITEVEVDIDYRVTGLGSCNYWHIGLEDGN